MKSRAIFRRSARRAGGCRRDNRTGTRSASPLPLSVPHHPVRRGRRISGEDDRSDPEAAIRVVRARVVLMHERRRLQIRNRPLSMAADRCRPIEHEADAPCCGLGKSTGRRHAKIARHRPSDAIEPLPLARDTPDRRALDLLDEVARDRTLAHEMLSHGASGRCLPEHPWPYRNSPSRRACCCSYAARVVCVKASQKRRSNLLDQVTAIAAATRRSSAGGAQRGDGGWVR